MFTGKTFYFYEKEYIYIRNTLCEHIQTLTVTDLINTYHTTDEDLDELIELVFLYTEGCKQISKSYLRTCIENSKKSVQNTSVLKSILYFLDVHHIDWRVLLSSSHLLLLLNYYEYAENHIKYVLNKDTYPDDEWESTVRFKFHTCDICEIIGNISLKHGKKIMTSDTFKKLDTMFDTTAKIIHF